MRKKPFSAQPLFIAHLIGIATFAIAPNLVFRIAVQAAEPPRAAGNIAPPPILSIARLAEQAGHMIPRQEYAAALENIQKGLEIDPTYIPLWRLKAIAHIALKQNAPAEEALQVCLLRDANDIEANVLLLKNAMEWNEVDPSERIRRVATQLRGMNPGLFADALTVFMRRRDFPEYLSLFLSAWNKSGDTLGQIRKVLGAYSGNHLQEAETYLDEIAKAKVPGLKPATLESLRRLIEEAKNPYATSAWNVDKGDLTHEEGHYTLTAKPNSDSFAWLRISEGWKDIAATVNFPGNFIGGTRSLYLRHRPPHSFVRITHNGSAILIQERVPNLGLFTLREIAPEEVALRPLRLVLKGERLGVFAGEDSLVELPLPISASVADGKIAMACENTSSEPEVAQYDKFTVNRIDDSWTIVSEDKSLPVADLRSDSDATAVLAVIAGSREPSAAPLATALLAAANTGLAVFGLLPEGSLDLKDLRKPLAQLPEILADRIWNGMVVYPSPNTDFAAVAELFEKIRESGRQSGLYLNNASAARLAAYQGNLYTDWLIIGEKQTLAEENLEQLERFYKNLLFEANGRLSANR